MLDVPRACHLADAQPLSEPWPGCAIARRQRSTRRGRPRAGWGRGRDRDYDWHSWTRTYLAPIAQAPVVIRRARPRRPSAQQPTASRACARSPARPARAQLPRYGSVHCCAAVRLQSNSWSWVPSVVELDGASRQRCDIGLTSDLLAEFQYHCWAPLPLQSNSWILVLLPVALFTTSMHLPAIRSVPSPFDCQLCAAEPLQVDSVIGVPLAVAPPASVRHLPAIPDETAPVRVRSEEHTAELQ